MVIQYITASAHGKKLFTGQPGNSDGGGKASGSVLVRSPVAVIKHCQKERRGLLSFRLTVLIIKENKGRNSEHELKKRLTVERRCTLACFWAPVQLLSYTAWTYQSGLGPPTPISNYKKNAPTDIA